MNKNLGRITEKRIGEWTNQLKIIKASIEAGGIVFSDKEKKFIKDISGQNFSIAPLSFRQSSFLRDIYNKIQ